MSQTRLGYVSLDNSTSTPLASKTSWTGSYEDVSRYGTAVVSLIASTSGSLIVDFSSNGTDTDSTVVFNYLEHQSEVHVLTVTRQYFRARVFNASTGSQTYLRMQTVVDSQTNITLPLNLIVQQDADATVVRSIDSEIDIANSKYEGHSIVNKLGRNPDGDIADGAFDLWNGGTTYTGFPTGSAEEFEVFSSSTSDTGTFTFQYLASTASTAYQSATVTLNGTTPVNTGIIGRRMHTAQYSSGNSEGFNIGTITLRHRTTTQNVFCVMPIGKSQTFISGYTVLLGYTAFIKRFFVRMIGSTVDSAEGALWVRGLNQSPRLRRPFVVTQTDHYEEIIYGGIVVPSLSDIQVRILSVSANNLDIQGGYDILLIKTSNGTIAG